MRDLIYQGSAVLWAAWYAIAAAHLIVFGLACGFNRARGGAKPW